MEAITVLASLTFLLALVVAGVNILTFWRKHRIHFKITNKDPSIHGRGGRTRNGDLESAEQDIIQAPAPILQSRLDNLQSPRRWQTYPLDRTNLSLQPQVSPTTNIFTPLTAATIPENPNEAPATPGSVSHFAPATYPRDPQGFPEQKP